MEENLHQQDNLDDFVQKSLDGYEEDPSPGMWNRIEGALDTPAVQVPKSPGLTTRWSGNIRHWWSVAAAVLFVMLGWAGICTYYERKIIALEITISQSNSSQKALSPEIAAKVTQKVTELMAEQQHRGDYQNTVPPANAPENAVIIPKKTQKSIPKTGGQEYIARPATPVNDRTNHQILDAKAAQKTINAPLSVDAATAGHHTAEVTTQTINNQAPNRQTDRATVPALQQNALQSNHHTPDNDPLTTPDNNTSTVVATHESGAEVTTPVANLLQSQPAETASKKIALEQLPGSSSLLQVPYPAPSAVPTLLPVIRPNHSGSDWYAGLRFTPGFIKENTTEKPTRPIERPVNGPRPARSTPVFVNESKKINAAAEWGLIFGKKINRYILLETGIAFTNLRQESVHQARFKFLEGRPHNSPGSGASRFDFDCNLNTYGGSAAVSLRMEQVDNSARIPATEPITVKITTNQYTQALKVPLLAGITFGKGRWKGVLKAGPEGYFTLSNQLEVNLLSSLNTKFQVESGKVPQLVFETTRRFSLGYRAAAGVHYRLSRHWSAVAEPVISGTFAQTDHLKQELPGIISTGVNLGINYHF